MISVILPDKSSKQLPEGSSGLDLAKSIGERLAKEAVGLSLNGELCDLNTTLPDGASIQIISPRDLLSLEFLRHTSAHILGCAVQRLYPQARIAIGPTIENGFYYDFLIPGASISIEDLPRIEAEMQKIIDANYKLTRSAIEDPIARIAQFQGQGEKFKAELLEKYQNDNPTQYSFTDEQGESVWSDLCRGPHLASTGQVKAFKLLSVSASYWQGNEKLDSLQRIYGTSWWSKKDLQTHLDNIAEAEKRDHRKLGREHSFFSTHEEAGPGLIFWHPKLAYLRNKIETLWRAKHEESGYELVFTPHIAGSELWQTSGHLDYYRENMFKLAPIDEKDYLLKPMNCPFHVLIYSSTRHSYRELPIRLAELGTVYRYERSGALHGLVRVRGFTQDDAHIFCTRAQLVEEVCAVIALTREIYAEFGLNFTAELSTRPEDRIGGEEFWDLAEGGLRQALETAQLEYTVNEGDGAFYGPKIDFKLRDSLGRAWQGATIQLDFNLPERFDLKYVNSEGQFERPVMLHRAIFGSLERFVGTLIEHYAGAFPFWLCYTQVTILPIADRHCQYARELALELRKHKIRVKVDERMEKVNAKIRDAQLDQIPYMLVIGDKELAEKQVAVRERRQGDLGVMNLAAFLELIAGEQR